MRSRRAIAFGWLLRKEWSELIDSRAWWVLLLVIAPLTGAAFISAVRTYAEVSGLNGTAAGVGEALSPLVGVWAPTFSACEIAAVFLLPFVVIRLAGGDRQSGALKLEAQHGLPAFARIAAKAMMATVGWLLAMLPPISTIALWKAYGGVTYAPELAALAGGHILNAALTIALGIAAASVSENPSTAAILTLTVTVGTWIVSFFGAIQGGWWERVAGYTPSAMVADFQHGLVKLDVVLIALVLILTGLGIAAVWIRLGAPVRRRVYESVAILALAAAVTFICSLPITSWDLSEDRANSFPRADEQALRQIRAPLRIEVHLAPEDPRRIDLDHRAIAKLRRIVPKLQVDYISATSIGLFEQTSAGYGEIWYSFEGRKIMSRATTAESALESIYSVTGITPPKEDEGSVFRGHPLAAQPRGAAALFCGVWPGIVLITGIFMRRRFR